MDTPVSPDLVAETDAALTAASTYLLRKRLGHAPEESSYLHVVKGLISDLSGSCDSKEGRQLTQALLDVAAKLEEGDRARDWRGYALLFGKGSTLERSGGSVDPGSASNHSDQDPSSPSGPK